MAEEVVAGRYVILEELGRGASATVFRARDTTLQRPVALKVISSSLAADPEFAWRFEQEALLSAKLDHPHIVTVHDVGTLADGRGFIAMRLLEGPSLDRLMAERGSLPPSEVADLITQLAGALDYTHAAGLIHRDVKPSNVKVDAGGWATLTDFGIARALDSARVTLPGLTIGTPRYMSPEQVRGENASPATDTYSLAVMAFEMLAGRAPFEGDGTALMYKIVHEPPPGLEEVSPGVSAEVAEVIRRGLDKDPGGRWASSGAFASALSAALRPAPVVDSSAAPTLVSRKPDPDATVVAPAAAATAVAPAEPATAVSPATTGTTVAAAAATSTVIPPATLVSAPEVATDAAASPEPPVGAEGGGGKKSRRGVLLALGGIAAVVAVGAAGAFALIGGGDDSNADDDDDDRNGSASDRETPRPTRTPRPTNTPPPTSLGALAATATPTPTAPAQPTATPPPPTTAAIPPTAIPPTTAPAPAVPALVDYVLCHTSAACPYGNETLLAGYAMYVIFELSPVTNAYVEMEVFFDGAFEYTSPFTASSTGVYFDTIPYAEVAGFLSLDIYADGEYVGTMYGDVN